MKWIERLTGVFVISLVLFVSIRAAVLGDRMTLESDAGTVTSAVATTHVMTVETTTGWYVVGGAKQIPKGAEASVWKDGLGNPYLKINNRYYKVRTP